MLSGHKKTACAAVSACSSELLNPYRAIERDTRSVAPDSLPVK